MKTREEQNNFPNIVSESSEMTYRPMVKEKNLSQLPEYVQSDIRISREQIKEKRYRPWKEVMEKYV